MVGVPGRSREAQMLSVTEKTLENWQGTAIHPADLERPRRALSARQAQGMDRGTDQGAVRRPFHLQLRKIAEPVSLGLTPAVS